MDDVTSAGGQASLSGDARLQGLWITTRDATRTAAGRAGRSSVAHPEKFLLHMYIGAAVSEKYIYLLPLFVY